MNLWTVEKWHILIQICDTLRRSVETAGLDECNNDGRQGSHGYVWYLLDVFRHDYRFTVTTFKYVEGGPDREALEVVWKTNSYI